MKIPMWKLNENGGGDKWSVRNTFESSNRFYSSVATLIDSWKMLGMFLKKKMIP